MGCFLSISTVLYDIRIPGIVNEDTDGRLSTDVLSRAEKRVLMCLTAGEGGIDRHHTSWGCPPISTVAARTHMLTHPVLDKVYFSKEKGKPIREKRLIGEDGSCILAKRYALVIPRL